MEGSACMAHTECPHKEHDDEPLAGCFRIANFQLPSKANRKSCLALTDAKFATEPSCKGSRAHPGTFPLNPSSQVQARHLILLAAEPTLQ
jgi:hypothetical protein